MEQTKPRIIITTDMEIDDMNSLIHLSLFLNEIDCAAIVYTASQFHFNGDGVHTLGEVTPHYRCTGEAAWKTHIGYSHPDPQAAHLKSYRPFPVGWIENLWKNEYAQAYPMLRQNASGYPTPEALLKITKYGNIDFEGDVRFETEGSNLIKDMILDDDPRLLYLLSWGGFNTFARALLSIEEEYENTPEWDSVYTKVIQKVRVLGVTNGVGQDNTYLDVTAKTYPDLVVLQPEFFYGTYFAPLHAPINYRYMFQPQWMKEQIKFNHGPLNSKYCIWGDGTYIEGEPEKYQYGQTTVLDWGLDAIPPVTFEPYTFLGEGDSITYVCLLPVGLRGLENGRYGTLEGRLRKEGDSFSKLQNDYIADSENGPDRFLKGYQEEWAARADWCIKPYEQCTHPSSVFTSTPTITAKPGNVAHLQAQAVQPDHLPLEHLWLYYPEGSIYNGKSAHLQVWEPLQYNTEFTIPKDAQPNDEFTFILQVRDTSATPITRYTEIVVRVD